MSRRRIYAAAALAALVVVAAVGLLVALATSDDEPPQRDRAALFVPSDVVAYVHLASDRDGGQWRRAGQAIGRLPAFESGLDRLVDALAVSGGGSDLQVRRDVVPWLGDETALALVRAPERESPTRGYAVLRVANRGGAERFLTRLGPVSSGPNGVRLRGSADFTGALADGFVLLGPRDLVTRALAAHAHPGSTLARDRGYRDALERLPQPRLVHAYVTRTGVRTPVAEGGAPLERLGLTDAAASLSLEGGRARFALRARPAARPRGCAAKSAQLRLLNSVAQRTVGYAGAPGVACVLEATGLEGLGRLQGEARRAGVDIARDVLPLLQGEGALTATTGRDTPALTLLVDRVPERRALEILERLEPALVRLFDTPALDQVPAFSARRVAGVSVLTAQVGPDLALSYAAFDGRLAVSTQPGGIVAVRGKGGLEGSDAFRDVLPDRPERPSALVFLDLDRLLALGEQVGLDEDPTYLTVRDDLQKLGAVGAFLSREGEHTTAELRFNIP